jgi:two-component system phosphate regulon response regulator PhoB
MPTKKVFLIQDASQLTAVVMEVLHLEGFAVETTDQAECILSTAANFHPDIIVLDDCFHQQNTLPVCKQLKSQSETRDIPVIIVSNDPQAAAWTRETGAASVLAKPISFFDLMDTVQSYVM